MENRYVACQLEGRAEYRELLCFKSISARREGVKCNTVTEKHCFLAFVYYKLRACVEVLYRMLPNESGIITLIFYYAYFVVAYKLALYDFLLNVNVRGAYGAGKGNGTFVNEVLAGAGRAYYVCAADLVLCRVNRLFTYGTYCTVAFSQVYHYRVFAVGALL